MRDGERVACVEEARDFVKRSTKTNDKCEWDLELEREFAIV